MSQHKGNHVKHTKYLGTLGEMLAADTRGIIAAAKTIRAKHRSPFGFCGPKRIKGAV